MRTTVLFAVLLLGLMVAVKPAGSRVGGRGNRGGRKKWLPPGGVNGFGRKSSPRKNLPPWYRPNGNRSGPPWRPANPDRGRHAGPRFRTLDPRIAKVRRMVVRFHNLFRAKTQPPASDMLALTWYEAAAGNAQSWAETCSLTEEMDHPAVRWTPRYGSCGQNVLVVPKKRRWAQVIRSWWSQRRHFTYGSSHNNISMVGPYTQMAWYNSHKVGCGLAECSQNGGRTFFRYVCNYCPGGNDPERLGRPYKKGASCEQCPHSCLKVCRQKGCRLCTNACRFSDLWANCDALVRLWPEWLCSTSTVHGIERFKNCRATCQCSHKIT